MHIRKRFKLSENGREELHRFYRVVEGPGRIVAAQADIVPSPSLNGFYRDGV